MSVEISDQDWDLLDKFTPGGISENDVASSIQAYRDEGRSDEEIQQALNNKISEAKTAFAKIAESNKQFKQDPTRLRAKKFLKVDKYIGPPIERLATTGYEVMNTMSLGTGEALAGLVDTVADTGLRDSIKEMRKKYPITSTASRVAGFFGGAPKAMFEAAGKATQKALGQATTKAGVVGRSMASSVAAGLAGQGASELERTAEVIANTRSIETSKEALDRLVPETAWNIGLSAGLGAIAAPIANTLSASKKAVNLLGEQNILNGQKAVQEALNSGKSAEDAAGIFLSEITKGLDETSAYHINKMIQKNPKFAEFIREQMVGAQQININTMQNVTAQTLQKYSEQMLMSLYGENYKNALGATDFDSTANGLKRLLGTHDKTAVFDARGKALNRAEQRVASNEMDRMDVQNAFNELSGALRKSGNIDYKRAVSKIEQNTLSSFDGSEEQAEAMGQVAEWMQTAREAGKQPTPAEVTDMTNNLLQAGAQKHFERIMAEGTDSVQTINEIKNFFTSIDEQAVAAGGAEAFGAFNEGVNAKILSPLDPVLAEANAAYRYQKTLLKSHGLGSSFDPIAPKMSEINSNLFDTTDVNIAGAKLAAFKMGFMEKLTNLAVTDRKAFNDTASAMTNPKTLGKFFSKSEVSEIMNQIKPHVEAAHNIENMLSVANGGIKPDNTTLQGIRTITSAGLGARGAFIGNLTTLFSGFKYGAGTAQKIMELSANPTLENLNKLVKGTTDLVEKQTLARSISQAVRMVAQTPTMQKGWAVANAIDKPEGE